MPIDNIINLTGRDILIGKDLVKVRIKSIGKLKTDIKYEEIKLSDFPFRCCKKHETIKLEMNKEEIQKLDLSNINVLYVIIDDYIATKIKTDFNYYSNLLKQIENNIFDSLNIPKRNYPDIAFIIPDITNNQISKTIEIKQFIR